MLLSARDIWAHQAIGLEIQQRGGSGKKQSNTSEQNNRL
jgi:hypothetical protein